MTIDNPTTRPPTAPCTTPLQEDSIGAATEEVALSILEEIPALALQTSLLKTLSWKDLFSLGSTSTKLRWLRNDPFSWTNCSTFRRACEGEGAAIDELLRTVHHPPTVAGPNLGQRLIYCFLEKANSRAITTLLYHLNKKELMYLLPTTGALARSCCHLSMCRSVHLHNVNNFASFCRHALPRFLPLKSLHLNHIRSGVFIDFSILFETPRIFDGLEELEIDGAALDFSFLQALTADQVPKDKLRRLSLKGSLDPNHNINLKQRYLHQLCRQVPELRELELGTAPWEIKSSAWHYPSIFSLINEDLKEIAGKLPNLESVHLVGMEDVSNEGVMNLAEGCRNIRSLAIGNRQITGEVLPHIFEKLNLDSFTWISLQGCRDDLFREIRGLSQLNLTGQIQLHDELLPDILRRNPDLKSLTITACNTLTSAGFIDAIASSPKLESLTIAACEWVDGAVLEQIPRLLPDLKELDISHCPEVREADLLPLASLDLCSLNIARNNTSSDVPLSENLITLFQDSFPSLERLNIVGLILSESARVQLIEDIESWPYLCELSTQDQTVIVSLSIGRPSIHVENTWSRPNSGC